MTMCSYQHTNLFFISIFLQISSIYTVPQIFTKVAGGENVRIEGIDAIYERSVSSPIECSLICQRHKCVFAQTVPQEKQPGLKCSLFSNIEDVSAVLVHHKSAKIVKLNEQLSCSNEDQDPILPLAPTPPLSSLPECLDWYENGSEDDGVYNITIGGKSTPVYCIMQDQQSFGAGWTVFQRRKDGFVDFYRSWLDYKVGFGNINGNHWLGLEKIHQFTKSKPTVEVLIFAKRFIGNTRFEHFEGFSVDGEITKYTITSGRQTGVNYGRDWAALNGMRFSTFDSDNDNFGDSNCAQNYPSGWWMNSCFPINLNGRYRSNGGVPSSSQGIIWEEFAGPVESLKETLIMMRSKKEESLESFESISID